MKKLAVTLLFLAATCAAAAPQTTSAPQPATGAADSGTHALRQKTFEKTWETVRDKFYDPNFNGVDWNGVRGRCAPKGVVVEGRGVIPDLEVNLTRAGLLRGSDAQLDAAIQYIKSHKTTKGTH